MEYSSMKMTMVRYTVKPGRADENEALIEAVYAELAAEPQEGLRYATFKMEDGVSFVHLATVAEGIEGNPLTRVAAFGRFTAEIADRCQEPPVTAQIDQVGAFRFFSNQ
jgi:hypothetical protein